MARRTTGRPAALAALLWMAAGGVAGACGFHGYAPAPSLVDRLLAAERIVHARPAPGHPFRYAAVRAVRGPLGGVEIRQLVDTATRQRLAREPGTTVLFAFDADGGRWQRLAIVGGAEGAVVETILARLEGWRGPDARDRFAYFAGLLGSDDPALRRLALTELDRAPYALLRGLDFRPPAGRLIEGLWSRSEFGLQPIKLLLLGLGGEAPARALLRSGLPRAAASPVPGRLRAHATALIENDGTDGLEALEAAVLSPTDIPAAVKEQALEAMALHSRHGDPALAPAIRALVARALARDPALAGPVARQFGGQSDWAQADAMLTVLRSAAPLPLADRLAVARYVALARQRSGRALRQ